MRKKYWFYLLCLTLSTLLFACSSNDNKEKNQVEAKGNNETEVEHRIVATTATVVEILDALEIDGVVGIPTTSSEIPERYKDVTEVGNAMHPDVEIIKTLNPTEVMSVTTLQSDLEEGFNSMGFNSTFVNLQSIENMKSAILDIGSRYNREEKAQELVKQIDNEVNAAVAKANELKKGDGPKALILLGLPGSYLVSTENSYIADLVSLLGGTNAIVGQTGEYLSSNTEFLQQSNPDVILRLAHAMPEEVIEMFDEEFTTNDVWKHFDAVKNDRVYDLEEKTFGTTAKLHMGEALNQLVDILYGVEE